MNNQNFQTLDIATGSKNNLWHELEIFLKIHSKNLSTPCELPIIFIIGTGRSGTHWLGWILETHPNFHVLIEKPPAFHWVTQMAVIPNSQKKLFPKLTKRYQAEAELAKPKILVDKSHPNLWIAEQLSHAFTNAKFLGVMRDPFGTTASMLKHEGVLSWMKNWQQYPVPNSFLGISKENAAQYETLSLPEQCALRWKSHRDKMDDVKGKLGDRFYEVNYSLLQKETLYELHKIQSFLNIDEPFLLPDIKSESLTKWQQELSVEDIKAIEKITGVYL